MKYGRRRRRKSSYNRRKISEVIVLSDAKESKNNVKGTTEEQTQDTDIHDENKDEVKEMEAPKDDPIHAPEDEECPVVFQNMDVQNDPPDSDPALDAVNQDDVEKIGVQNSSERIR